MFAGESQLAADVRDTASVEVSERDRARTAAMGVRARIAVPLYAGGRVIGALVVASTTPAHYTDVHVHACRQIADLIGPFVHNVVLLHRGTRYAECYTMPD